MVAKPASRKGTYPWRSFASNRRVDGPCITLLEAKKISGFVNAYPGYSAPRTSKVRILNLSDYEAWRRKRNSNSMFGL
jgi:hypothetical protein